MDEFSKHFLILYLFQGREQGCVCDNEAGTVELICHLMGACVGVWAWPLLLGGWRVVNVFCNCVFIFKESRLGNQLGNDGCSTHSPPPPLPPSSASSPWTTFLAPWTLLSLLLGSTLVYTSHSLNRNQPTNHQHDKKIPPKNPRTTLRMLSSVLASSAIALAGLLIAAPAHVDALVTPPGSGSHLGHIAARHLPGVSPNHHALARRKRNVHKNRKRCQQRPASSTPAPQQTGDYSGGDGGNKGNDNSGNNGGGNNNNNPGYTSVATTTTTQPPYTPPPSNPGNGNGKLLLAWPNGPDRSMSQYFTGHASRYVQIHRYLHIYTIILTILQLLHLVTSQGRGCGQCRLLRHALGRQADR